MYYSIARCKSEKKSKIKHWLSFGFGESLAEAELSKSNFCEIRLALMHGDCATLPVTIDERILVPTPLVGTDAATADHLLCIFSWHFAEVHDTWRGSKRATIAVHSNVNDNDGVENKTK